MTCNRDAVQRRSAADHQYDGNCLTVSATVGLGSKEWKSAYARYYATQFGTATDDRDGDGPLLAAAFPHCDKTARAVRDTEWLLDLLAEHVVNARPCACDRAPDDDPMCACVLDAAAAFQAATAEFHGDGAGRRAEEMDYERRCNANLTSRHSPVRQATTGDGAAADSTTAAIYRHMRAAVHHAISAKRCRCSGMAGRQKLCFHECLLHTVFLGKVHESYGRAGRRGQRDAETQTSRGGGGGGGGDDDDDDRVTGRAATGATATTARRVENSGDDGAPAAVKRPSDLERPQATSSNLERSGRGWNPFRWLLRSKTRAAVEPAAVKRPKSPRKVKYIQVRVHPKKKKNDPTEIATAGQPPIVAAGSVSPSPELVPPPSELSYDTCAGRGPTASDGSETDAADRTARTKIRGTLSRTGPMALRRPLKTQIPTAVQSLLSATSTDSVCIDVCSL